jgi:hypothetical protein
MAFRHWVLNLMRQLPEMSTPFRGIANGLEQQKKAARLKYDISATRLSQ